MTLAISCAGPTRWGQFHSDGANGGFVGVHSANATKAKWFADVGGSSSSPVIGPDGTIYVSNGNGEIVAVNPGGTEKWRFPRPFTDGSVVSGSPAVSSAGFIYFIVNHYLTKGSVTHPWDSFLFGLDPRGTVRCTFRFPASVITWSSPNVWTSVTNETNVFVAAVESFGSGAVRVFDDRCNQIAIQTWNCPHDLIGGGLPPCCTFHVDPVPPLFDPTPAIVVAGVTACGLHTFVWDPSARTLTPMWVAPNPRNYISSPAVSQSGQVVMAQDDGHVLAFDLISGKLLWDYDAGESVFPRAPAFFLGKTDVYVASDAHVHEIDAGGTLVQKINFAPGATNAAVTWDRVYIGSSVGLQTLKFNLSVDAVDNGAFDSGPPAVGPDGTVYVVAADHLLRAYPRF
jgi:outer membrane protein assembly factor BamB